VRERTLAANGTTVLDSPMPTDSVGQAFAGDARTLAALWRNAAAAQRQGAAYVEQSDGRWRVTSWQEADRRVDELAHGLLARGVGKGDRIAVLGPSCVDWALLDFALLSIGAAVVPIYPTSSPSEITYILENAEACGIVTQQPEQLEGLPALPHRLSFADLDRLAEKGREHAATHPDAVELAALAVTEDDLLTCIYTSGTTGPPKGCLLSNRAYFEMVRMLAELPDLVRPGDRTVLFLPLAHNFGRLVHFTAARVGYTIAFCPDVAGLAATLEHARPHFLPSVPRVYEKLYAAVRSELDDAVGAKRAVAQWALAVGREASAVRQAGKPLPPVLALRHRLADRLLFSKVKAKLGGELRFGISGGAPCSREILEFFHGLDILVLEGYGLTECTSIAINVPGAFRFGSVGRPIPGCEVQIASDGEILVRGETLFEGYYRNEEATREALRDDGWFRSGDIGELDADGFLRITDRKKDLIATAGGKKISPQNIERLLQGCALVSHALIVGDRRPYVTALIALNDEEVAAWARTHGLDSDVRGSERLKKELQSAVDEANSQLGRPEQIKRFAILPRDFSAEEGEVTPTMKLKRRICEQHFATEVEALYATRN
jgi:long-chain acyl-CoA synthetase